MNRCNYDEGETRDTRNTPLLIGPLPTAERQGRIATTAELVQLGFLKPAHELQSRSTCGCPPHFSGQFSHNFVLELYRLPDVERSIALNLAAIARDVRDDNRKARAISPKGHDFERHLGAKTAW